ncbi:MAG: Arc family DNA-binding protein [Roseburia sp.]
MATNKIPTMLRLPETLHAQIKKLSNIEHRSMNMEIEYILSSYVTEYERKNGIIPADPDEFL